MDKVHVIKQCELAGVVSSERFRAESSTGLDGASPLEMAVEQATWFASGHSGCVFARLAAIKDHGWHFVVAEQLDSVTAGEVASAVLQLMADPTCEVVSVLLPLAITEMAALEAIAQLCEVGLLRVEKAVLAGGRRSAHVRLPVTDDVVAWVMAFGPFENMPATRRSPYFELAMRVRPKDGELFHRLNQDPAIAHLADLPMEMPERYWEHRWSSTLQRTRRILGSDPDSFSAARCTFTTTTEVWESVGIEAFAATVVDSDSPIAEYGNSEPA